MGPDSGAGAAGRSGSARRLVAALVIADTAYAFQQSAIIPAIPTVQDEFGITEAWSAWLLTGYLMVATVATPALGRFADLHGRKRTLAAALLVFLIGSIGAAAAQGIAMLLADVATRGGRPGHAAFLIAAGLALLGGVLALFIPRVDEHGVDEQGVDEHGVDEQGVDEQGVQE